MASQQPSRRSNSKHNETKSACQDYVRIFYNNNERNHNKDVNDKSEHVLFMLQHPFIRKKLAQWLEQQKPPAPGDSDYTDYDDLISTQQQPTKSNEKVTKLLDSALSKPKSVNVRKYEKCHETALKERQLGNKSFIEHRQLNACLDHYNESLRYSSFKTTEQLIDIGICLANRSAVLFELGKYLEALIDINLALDKYNYPQHLKHKVLLRKIQILVKLKANNKEEVEELITNTRKEFESIEISSKQVFLKKLEELSIQAQAAAALEEEGKTGKTSAADKKKKNVSEEEQPQSSNLDYEFADPALQIKYSPTYSRHVISNEDLKLGDVIYEELPYASVLLPEYYNSHCYHCHRRLEKWTFFPCSNCTQVKYCSEHCSTKSWTESHQHECLYLDFLAATGIAQLALRIVLTTGKSLVIKTMEEFNTIEKVQALRMDLSLFNKTTDESEEVKNQQKYLRVFSLLDHLVNMKPEDAFQYSLTAALLVYFLCKNTSFFGENSNPEHISLIGGAILHHICQLICNANALSSIDSELNRDDASLTELTQVRVASGIYPSASLMNHACSPNIISCFKNGRTLITKIGVESLQAGSELHNCYGPHFRRMNVKDRQDSLEQQYFFKCQCTICLKEMADGFSFADKFVGFKCPNCCKAGFAGYLLPDYDNQIYESICSGCNKIHNLKSAMEIALKTDKLFAMGMEYLNKGDVQIALENYFIKCYNKRKKILYRFHSDLGNFSDCLAKCYALLGDYKSALQFTQQSLEYVQERFGINSSEWAREFIKYTEIKAIAKSALVVTNEGSNEDKDEINERQQIATAQKILQLYNQTNNKA